MIEKPYEFRTTKCWFTLWFRLVWIQMFCISRVSHSIDICTVTIKNIRNIHTVSTNQIADILHFNDNYLKHIVAFTTNLIPAFNIIIFGFNYCDDQVRYVNNSHCPLHNLHRNTMKCLFKIHSGRTCFYFGNVDYILIIPF